MSEPFRVRAAGCGIFHGVLVDNVGYSMPCGALFQVPGRDPKRIICPRCNEDADRVNKLLVNYTVTGLEHGIELLTAGTEE